MMVSGWVVEGLSGRGDARFALFLLKIFVLSRSGFLAKQCKCDSR